MSFLTSEHKDALSNNGAKSKSEWLIRWALNQKHICDSSD
ncbi:hypothetical protein V6Z11_D05G262000 [Gossypium hirsutum]